MLVKEKRVNTTKLLLLCTRKSVLMFLFHLSPTENPPSCTTFKTSVEMNKQKK